MVKFYPFRSQFMNQIFKNTLFFEQPVHQGVSYLLERRPEVIWRSNMYVTKKIINYQILILFISLNQYKIKFLFNQLLTLKKPLVPKKMKLIIFTSTQTVVQMVNFEQSIFLNFSKTNNSKFMNFSEYEQMIITQYIFDFEQYWLSMQVPMNICIISF